MKAASEVCMAAGSSPENIYCKKTSKKVDTLDIFIQGARRLVGWDGIQLFSQYGLINQPFFPNKKILISITL